MLTSVAFQNDSIALLESIRVASEKQERECPFGVVVTPWGTKYHGVLQVKGDYIIVHYAREMT